MKIALNFNVFFFLELWSYFSYLNFKLLSLRVLFSFFSVFVPFIIEYSFLKTIFNDKLNICVGIYAYKRSHHVKKISIQFADACSFFFQRVAFASKYLFSSSIRFNSPLLSSLHILISTFLSFYLWTFNSPFFENFFSWPSPSSPFYFSFADV